MMTTNTLSLEQKNTLRRARVRPYVTYTVILAYTITTTFATIWLLVNDQTDNALALLSGLSAVATGIVGFWFGARGQEKRDEEAIASNANIEPITPKHKSVKEKVLAILNFRGQKLADLAGELKQKDVKAFETLLENPDKISGADKQIIAKFLKTKTSNLFG